MIYFDVYQYGEHIGRFGFSSYEDAIRLYPLCFGYTVRRSGNND